MKLSDGFRIKFSHLLSNGIVKIHFFANHPLVLPVHLGLVVEQQRFRSCKWTVGQPPTKTINSDKLTISFVAPGQQFIKKVAEHPGYPVFIDPEEIVFSSEKR